MKKDIRLLAVSISILLIISALSFVSVPPLEKRADALGVFGGQINGVLVCGCSGWTWFSVGPPRPAQLILTTYTTPPFYPNRRISNGVWTLGTHVGTAQCQTGPKCPVVATGQIVQLMGTSL